MKPIIALAVIAMLLSACAQPTPSPQLIQTSIAQTQAALPTYTPTPEPTSTPTPTPVPLSDLDLTPYMIQDGDLPAGFTPAQFRDQSPGLIGPMPRAENEAFIQFERSGESAGGVTILIYEDLEKAKSSYKLAIKNQGDTSISYIKGIGEQDGRLVDLDEQILFTSIKALDLIFQRCHAVVNIRLAGTSDNAAMESYAKRLDARITPLVCR